MTWIDVEKRPFQKCCYRLETKYSLTKIGFSESISDSGKLLLEINQYRSSIWY